ncbi:hypothetical protein NL676_011248 [Syzygium grande]|nr:hypothetical protein NL676_011248 [Syzygium grande]
METHLKLPFVNWEAVIIAVLALERDAIMQLAVINASEPKESNPLGIEKLKLPTLGRKLRDGDGDGDGGPSVDSRAELTGKMRVALLWTGSASEAAVEAGALAGGEEDESDAAVV